jgi:hypothetical protein
MILLPVQQLDCFYHLFYKHKLHDKGAQFYTIQAVYEAKPISFFLEYAGAAHHFINKRRVLQTKTTLATPLDYIRAFVENKTTY